MICVRLYETLPIISAISMLYAVLMVFSSANEYLCTEATEKVPNSYVCVRSLCMYVYVLAFRGKQTNRKRDVIKI